MIREMATIHRFDVITDINVLNDALIAQLPGYRLVRPNPDNPDGYIALDNHGRVHGYPDHIDIVCDEHISRDEITTVLVSLSLL